MKAAVCERYGPPEVVTIREVPSPRPAAGEVLIEAHATTVNSGDARIRAARFPRGMGVPVRLSLGVTKPRKSILGFDVAARVEAVGTDVTSFQAGDRVVASPGFDFGAHAEHVVVAADGAIAAIPNGLGDQDAVAVCFGGMTALHFFEHGRVTDGESLLINGAAGAVGTMAIQLANRAGAEVTAVCSAAHAGLVTSLGARHVVDYATEDFTRNGRRYDVIMDNHGSAPYARVKGSLAAEGRFLMVIGDLWQTLGAARRKDVISGTAAASAERFRTLMELTGRGELKPVIDSVVPFERIVEAHRRVDTGHKAGSVVVAFDHAGER
jgi:NADPH:quinone reductase-like Zn-dependent oxidoreductase